MNAYNFSLLFFSFCTFFIGLLIWLKRQDKIGRTYLIFSLFVTLWSASEAVQLSDGIDYEKALFFARLSHLGGIFIPASWFHFTLSFLHREQKQKLWIKLFYYFTCLIALLVFTPFFIPKVEPILTFRYFARTGPLYHFFSAIFFIFVPVGFYQILNKIQSSQGAEKKQLIGFCMATASGFIGGAPAFLPAYDIPFPQYGFFLLPVYPFLMAYFMIRQRLFDLHDLAEIVHRDKLASMSTLAASINHEIRNPLYVIRSQAEICLEKIASKGTANLKPDDLSGALSGMIAQSNRALEIIKKFSGFAKRNTEEALKPEWVSLKEAVVNVLPLLAHEMELETIQFICNIPEDFPKVYADPRHLEEIFFNLISNACQTLKSTGGMIRVDAKAAGDKVRVTVADNGPGIEAGALERIFEPFYTTKTDGTGLGLYITKQLVEKNGGTISVESAAGKGTTFVLLFGIK